MANLFWGKKKIAVVGVNGNPMAKRIVEEMKAQGMKGVVELDAGLLHPGTAGAGLRAVCL